MLYSLEQYLVYGFVKGLVFPLYLASGHIIIVMPLFFHILDYVRDIKRAYIGTY